MNVLNDTPFKISWIVARLRPSELTGTFVVKGTFQIAPGAPATPVEEGELPTGDVPDPAGPEGALLFESDMAPLKPLTDVLLTGTCHAPGGKPVTVCPVTLRCAGIDKTLFAIGKRTWERSLGVQIPSNPEPFTSLHLHYGEAYGGPDFPLNPIGKGNGGKSDGNGERLLPRVEHPSQLLKSPTDNIPPAGFGPIPREWPQRSVNMGTCTAAYMKERWPWFPEDFDFVYFNAAPPDQRLKAYLKGDETFTAVNMHATQPVFEGKFPGLRPQVFLLDAKSVLPPGRVRQGLREVALNLDTVCIDTDSERLTLVWRGIAPVGHIKMKDVEEVHVADGSLDAPRWTPLTWAEECRRREIVVEEAEAVEEEPAGEPEELPDMPAEVAKIDAKIETDKAEAKLTLKDLGLNPALLDTQPPAADHAAGLAQAMKDLKAVVGVVPAGLADQEATLNAMGPSDEDNPVESPPWTRERVERTIAEKGTFDEQDLSALDLSGLDFSGLSLAGADFSGATLMKARFTGAALGRATFTGANLAEADLTEAVASEAVFAGADLTGARLSKIELADADLTKALLDGADLEGADLARSLFCKASLKGARLDRVHGRIADFSGADLTGARLCGNRLDQPDFRSAVLEKADFTDAVMKNATLEECRGAGVIMSGADLDGLRASKAPDLTGGDFRKIRASKSNWEGAILDRATFDGAVVTAGNFACASLLGASFNKADLSRAVFEECRIEKTSIVGSKVFRGSFERAVIRGSDFRNSSFYETEFWDAVIEDTLFNGSDLKMTKLEK